MKKGAAYQLTVDDLKTDKGREKNRARHIRPLQVKLEASKASSCDTKVSDS